MAYVVLSSSFFSAFSTSVSSPTEGSFVLVPGVSRDSVWASASNGRVPHSRFSASLSLVFGFSTDYFYIVPETFHFPTVCFPVLAESVRFACFLFALDVGSVFRGRRPFKMRFSACSFFLRVLGRGLVSL